MNTSSFDQGVVVMLSSRGWDALFLWADAMTKLMSADPKTLPRIRPPFTRPIYALGLVREVVVSILIFLAAWIAGPEATKQLTNIN